MLLCGHVTFARGRPLRLQREYTEVSCEQVIVSLRSASNIPVCISRTCTGQPRVYPHCNPHREMVEVRRILQSWTIQRGTEYNGSNSFLPTRVPYFLSYLVPEDDFAEFILIEIIYEATNRYWAKKWVGAHILKSCLTCPRLDIKMSKGTVLIYSLLEHKHTKCNLNIYGVIIRVPDDNIGSPMKKPPVIKGNHRWCDRKVQNTRRDKHSVGLYSRGQLFLPQPIADQEWPLQHTGNATADVGLRTGGTTLTFS